MEEPRNPRPWAEHRTNTRSSTPRTPSTSDTLLEMLEEAHKDSSLDYLAYLQRLETLRILSRKLSLPLPDDCFAVRIPRRKGSA